MPAPPVLTLLLSQPMAAGAGSGAADPAVPGAWAPLLLLGLPVGVAILLLGFYVRTARQHRRALMAPPVWLLPYLETERAGEEGRPAAPPAPDADHIALEELRVESTARLARRKRVLLAGLALNFVAGWAGAAVYLYSANRQVAFQELPAFSAGRLEDVVDTAAFQGLEDQAPGSTAAPAAAGAPLEEPDTAALRLRRERQALLSARRRDSLAELARLDSVALAAEIAQRVRDSVARALQDSIARAAAVAVPPPPRPEPRASEPDAAVLRSRAAEVLREAAAALVSGIRGGAGLRGLLGEGEAQARFLRFIEEYRPTAEPGQLSPAEILGGAATATAEVRLGWRGGFGQSRAATGRFRIEAVREGEGWRVIRVVPLQDFP